MSAEFATTTTGLTVRCELDNNVYQKGIVVTNHAMENINITRNAFHGDWNYTIPLHTANQSD